MYTNFNILGCKVGFNFPVLLPFIGWLWQKTHTMDVQTSTARYQNRIIVTARWRHPGLSAQYVARRMVCHVPRAPVSRQKMAIKKTYFGF